VLRNPEESEAPPRRQRADPAGSWRTGEDRSALLHRLIVGLGDAFLSPLQSTIAASRIHFNSQIEKHLLTAADGSIEILRGTFLEIEIS
jgi:hypothetical protein